MEAQGSGKRTFLVRAWRAIRWALAALVVAYVVLVIWRIPAVAEQKKSAQLVEQIQAQRLTLADADGSHLPPPPAPKEVDATVAGVDANGNGIRDDVELAIFKLYPNSPYTRAAELQYAMTEQMFLTDVIDTATWKAAAEEDGRANLCLIALGVGYEKTKSLSDEVEKLVFDTQARQNAKEKAFTFTTSHGDASGKTCDVEIQ